MARKKVFFFPHLWSLTPTLKCLLFPPPPPPKKATRPKRHSIRVGWLSQRTIIPTHPSFDHNSSRPFLTRLLPSTHVCGGAHQCTCMQGTEKKKDAFLSPFFAGAACDVPLFVPKRRFPFPFHSFFRALLFPLLAYIIRPWAPPLFPLL